MIARRFHAAETGTMRGAGPEKNARTLSAPAEAYERVIYGLRNRRPPIPSSGQREITWDVYTTSWCLAREAVHAGDMLCFLGGFGLEASEWSQVCTDLTPDRHRGAKSAVGNAHAGLRQTPSQASAGLG